MTPTFQQIILSLQEYWAAQGCALLHPYDMDVGADTSHTATFLRAIGLRRRSLFGWLLAWDEFFYALLFTSNITAQTLPVTIAGFTAGRATDDGRVAAVGSLASVPPLFIAIWLQKTLVSGLTHGGSKG